MALQDGHDCFFCVVDLHSMTLSWDPSALAQRTRQTAASLLACGIDPDRSSLFVQSEVPEHTELAWILTCLSKMGELSRMTQFKDKSAGAQSGAVGTGLFVYPALMAADVLAYRAELVPVGDDQRQHLELMRDLAERFNKTFGETFPVPQAVIAGQGSRIMALDDPSRKMDKSSDRPNNLIWMSDPADVVRRKISRAVTDSGREIVHAADKPAISNLIEIFAAVTSSEVAQVQNDFSGKGYGEFKSALAEAVISFLEPFQQRYRGVLADKGRLDGILDEGARKAREAAAETLIYVREKIGVRKIHQAARPRDYA